MFYKKFLPGFLLVRMLKFVKRLSTGLIDIYWLNMYTTRSILFA